MKSNTTPTTNNFTLGIILIIAALFYGCSHLLPKPTTNVQFIEASQVDHVLIGHVIYVYDGDTILVRSIDGTETRIRLKGIDAPESKQAYGKEAGQKLNTLSFNKDVQIFWQEKDRYGRTVGKVMIGDTDLNLAMIEAGLAWHFTKYELTQSAEDRQLYKTTEKRVREQHKGLWADPSPLPPWEYRRQHRENQNESLLKLMSTNGKNNGGPNTDDERVALTLTQMQQAAELQELNDLELIDLIVSAPLGDDPRLYELMSRLNPNWTNDLADAKQEPTPTYVSLAIPISVAYNQVAYDHCRCDNENSPCIYCSCNAAIFRATKDEDFRPRPRPV